MMMMMMMMIKGTAFFSETECILTVPTLVEPLWRVGESVTLWLLATVR